VYESSMETKWVCIQLACSWRPRAFEEARHRNIHAKFYNEKFPLVYESDISGDFLYEEHGATLQHKCGKMIVALPVLSFSLIFIFFVGIFWPLSLLFSSEVSSRLVGESSSPSSFPHCDNALIMMIITLLFTYNSKLQLDTRTKYESI
jgi:hypothetical protein